MNYLPAPASEADYVPREDATAMQRVVLSEGLKAEFITRAVGEDADMMACKFLVFDSLFSISAPRRQTASLRKELTFLDFPAAPKRN